MPSGGPSRIRLGIDLIEFKKAKDFYKHHQNRLASFFSEKEISYIGHGAEAYRKLAGLLAAKEAAFKASGKTWMGPEGFAAIRLTPPTGKKNFFSVKKSSQSKEALKIFLTQQHKKYVVAQCVGI